MSNPDCPDCAGTGKWDIGEPYGLMRCHCTPPRVMTEDEFDRTFLKVWAILGRSGDN